MSSYSFKDCNAAITGPGGLIALGNGAGTADEGITIDPTGDISGMQVGSDGNGQHSLYADKSGRVTVRLLKTSPTNRMLQLMYDFQTASSSQHGQNTIVINDSKRGDVITALQAAFVRRPTINYAKDAGTQEWMFDAIRIEVSLGDQ